MDIGKTRRVITVQPVELPKPKAIPIERPAEPVRVAEPERERVPVR